MFLTVPFITTPNNPALPWLVSDADIETVWVIFEIVWPIPSKVPLNLFESLPMPSQLSMLLKSISPVKTKVFPDILLPAFTWLARYCNWVSVEIAITEPVTDEAVIEPSIAYFNDANVVDASAVVDVV